MKNENTINFTDDPVNEAAEWFIRLRDNTMSEEDYLQWQTWLAKSEANMTAFAKAEKCWNELEHITDLPWPLLPEESNGAKARHRVSPLRRFWPLAASIAATVVIILSFAVAYHFNYFSAPKATTYQTARAEHKSITLEDGSKIFLGARTIVNVNYSKMARHITLVRGEAVFDVAKNKQRPFIVKTGNGTVTAVGTKFNIHESHQNVIVTVIEGIVEVNPFIDRQKSAASPLPRVSAGKAISYLPDGYITKAAATNVDAATSWEKGLLVRVDTSLASVIEDVNRYSSREIIIGDPALNNIRFTGTVLNDGIDNWLRGLSVAYPIKVLDTGHDAILLLKKTE